MFIYIKAYLHLIKRPLKDQTHVKLLVQQHLYCPWKQRREYWPTTWRYINGRTAIEQTDTRTRTIGRLILMRFRRITHWIWASALISAAKLAIRRSKGEFSIGRHDTRRSKAPVSLFSPSFLRTFSKTGNANASFICLILCSPWLLYRNIWYRKNFWMLLILHAASDQRA